METILTSPQAKRPQSGRAILRIGSRVPVEAFAGIRRRTILEGCKWDPQVGEVGTLADFPLWLAAVEWQKLAGWAERLTEEMLAAETEILARPELMDSLGLPRALRRVLAKRIPLTPAAARIVRFDFHPTTEGWRISEANSDVPGGFCEASFFTRLMAATQPDSSMAGDPAAQWADTIAGVAGVNGTVALLSAPGYMEDQQVTAFFARVLRERGLRGILASPEQLLWRDGIAHLETACYRGPVAVVERFVQGEWLPKIARRCGWPCYFRGGRTPVANPGISILTESKRFPLVWNELKTSLQTWDTLLPETRDPREISWWTDDGWVLKSALCNTGDTVWMRELTDGNRSRQLERALKRHPEDWVAQRRFIPEWLQSPMGPVQVCVGVYTVNGLAAGAYARLRAGLVIDFQSTDVALLISSDDG